MARWTSKQARKSRFIPVMRELVRCYQAFERFDARLRGELRSVIKQRSQSKTPPITRRWFRLNVSQPSDRRLQACHITSRTSCRLESERARPAARNP